jgi:hypothetical protein
MDAGAHALIVTTIAVTANGAATISGTALVRQMELWPDGEHGHFWPRHHEGRLQGA